MQSMLSSIELVEINKRNGVDNSHRFHMQIRKWGKARTSGYTRGGIKCQGGESIPCRPVTPTVSPIPDQVNGTNRSQD
jgi:hypothetical protein